MAARASDQELRSSLEANGYLLLPEAVHAGAVTRALRMLNLAIRRHGLSSDEINECQQTTFFPHLRWEPEVWGVLPEVAGRLLGEVEGDEWATPQILIRFPDEDQPWPVVPHVDEPPEWAGGRQYRGIVGVALTDAGADDGSAMVWPGSHHSGSTGGAGVNVPMSAGDALLMHPLLRHAGTLNRGPRVRHAIYFRLIASP